MLAALTEHHEVRHESSTTLPDLPIADGAATARTRQRDRVVDLRRLRSRLVRRT